MSEASSSKHVRFAESNDVYKIEQPGAAHSKQRQDDEYDSDGNDELEDDITSSRRRGKQIKADGYGSDASDQDEVANLSDISDEEGLPAREADATETDDIFANDDDGDKDMDQLEKKRKRFLDIDDIVGQEMSSVSRTESTFDDFDLKGKRSASAKPDGENKIKIEAFNMRDDLEEGNFDATGTFVWNKKDPQAYQDEWLSSVSKGAIERARESKDKQKQKQSAQTDKLALRWDTVSNEDLVLAIINMLEPRETVFAALARIGGSGAKQKKKKVNKWSKKGRAQMDTVDDEKERERKRLIERLTELADQAMARGISGIYDDSYEQMVRQMRVADRIPDDWMPGTLLPTTAQDEPMSTGSDPEGGLLDDIL